MSTPFLIADGMPVHEQKRPQAVSACGLRIRNTRLLLQQGFQLRELFVKRTRLIRIDLAEIVFFSVNAIKHVVRVRIFEVLAGDCEPVLLNMNPVIGTEVVVAMALRKVGIVRIEIAGAVLARFAAAI